MWYLPKPTDKDLSDYVTYMSAKIKNTAEYAALQGDFECDIKGHHYDFVDMLLEAKPQCQLALNRFLMKRLFNNPHYAEGDIDELTKAVAKRKTAQTKGRQPNLTVREQQIIATYEHRTKQLRKVFDYSKFISKDADFSYTLSHVKETNACPYCNRQYTLTIEKKTRAGEVVDHIAKPHFDHWFAKTTFPLLSLSFYNLVPSCSVCNSSIKGSTLMQINNHMHPYCQERGYEPSFKFRVLFTGDKDFELYTTKSKIAAEEQMKKDFFIEDAYKYHEQLEVADLVKMYREHEETYLKKWMKATLRDLLPTKSVSEIIRMVFGAEINAGHLNDRPMSKLKKDLLEQFHIIDHNGNIHPELIGE